MVTRGCCLPGGSCVTAVSLWGNSCSPLPPCCGWDPGWVWTLTRPWSCCAWQGRRWASPPPCWRASETAWCSFASGPSTCPSTRWAIPCLSLITVLVSLGWLADLSFQVGQVFLYFQWWVYGSGLLLPLPPRSPKHVIFCLILLLSQGQPSSGDGLPLYPHCSPDINQRVTRGPRPRPCHLLVDPLAAVQADVRLGRGQAHVALSHVVGAHRCASRLFFSR